LKQWVKKAGVLFGSCSGVVRLRFGCILVGWGFARTRVE